MKHSSWFWVGLLLLFGMAASLLPTASAQNFSGMVSFGDSLSGRGNTVTTLTGLLGEDIVRQQTGYNGNFYSDQRFSNGPLWSEILYGELGFGTLKRNNGVDFLTGTNFSWAGSTNGTGITLPLLPNLPPLGFKPDYLGDPLIGAARK